MLFGLQNQEITALLNCSDLSTMISFVAEYAEENGRFYGKTAQWPDTMDSLQKRQTAYIMWL